MVNLPKKNRSLIDKEEDEGGGQSGGSSGGASGEIAFRDFLGTGETRDDLLSGNEKKRLLNVHEKLHEALVIKQKVANDKRQQLKEGKMSLQDYRQSINAGQYGYHPILSQAAQFSGMDSQVNYVPTENTAETNAEKGEELRYQYTLAYQPSPRIRHASPKPTPFK